MEAARHIGSAFNQKCGQPRLRYRTERRSYYCILRGRIRDAEPR